MKLWREAFAALLGVATLVAGFAAAQGARVALNDAAEKAKRIEQRLQKNPNDATAVRELHLLLATPNDLTREESMRLRGVVRTHASEARQSLVIADEPGDAVAISGMVRDSAGRPIAGAHVTIFQTDAKGFYSPLDEASKRMDEPNSRIFGFLRTSAEGQYEFRTVRPGGYPFPLKGRTGDRALVPAHIHFAVEAPGFIAHTCDTGYTCQIVFADDPRMTPHWQKWARDLHFPVLTLKRNATGILKATYDITLRKDGE